MKSPDQETVMIGLQFIEMSLRNFPGFKEMFEATDGVACLEALEYNRNETVCQCANEILDTYFVEEDQGDENTEQEDESGGTELPQRRYEENKMSS